jgi:IMP dehydrogenase
LEIIIMAKLNLDELLTYDDVLLEPQKTEIDPSKPNLRTKLTKDIKLSIPIVSSPMDTVSGKEMCIAMAQHGGVGILHRNYTVDEQVKCVGAVKSHEGYIIEQPVTVLPHFTIGEVKKIARNLPFQTFPVVDEAGVVQGILSHTDFYLEGDSTLVKDRMSVNPETISLEDSTDRGKVRERLREKKKKRLLVTDKSNKLLGLITGKDFLLREKYPYATRDKEQRLVVGAAVGVGEKEYERVEKLYRAGADFLVIDISHGDCQPELDMIKYIKSNYSIPVIGGNVATVQGVEDIVAAGADAVRIGFGAGSICITRLISGSGIPQFSAVVNCATKARELGVYSIADGGIKQYGHMGLALAYADTVMLGNLLAGVDESPGRKVLVNGRYFKEYRGMGSAGAINERAGGGRSRYELDKDQKIVPQGVEGRVDYTGPLDGVLYQMKEAIKLSLATSGAENLEEFRKKAKVNRISRSGSVESHPSVVMTEQPSNYMRQ